MSIEQEGQGVDRTAAFFARVMALTRPEEALVLTRPEERSRLELRTDGNLLLFR